MLLPTSVKADPVFDQAEVRVVYSLSEQAAI